MSADRKYLINAEMLGGIELDGVNSAYTQITAADAIGAVDTELSGGINGANLISAINSAYAAASGNEPGAPAASVQFNNGADGFAGSEYWLVSEVASGAVSTLSGSFSLTGSNSSLSVSGQSTLTGNAYFAAGQTIAADQSIDGAGALSITSGGEFTLISAGAVGVTADAEDISLTMGDDIGAYEVAFLDSALIRVAGIDSSGNADFDGTLSAGGAFSAAGLASLNGGIAVDTDKFTVADATGNTAISGTLDVIGVSQLATGGGATSAGGVFSAAGLASLNGGIAVDTDRFTVADTTGNTTIAGTLDVTGAIGGTSTISATGQISTTSTDGFKLRGTNSAGDPKNYALTVVGGILVATESAV